MPDYLMTGAADYHPLRDSLQAQNWKTSDRETRRIMLQISQRLRMSQNLPPSEAEWLVNLDYLTEEDGKQFPLWDLCILDNLWTHYSDGQFGFSIQAQIWQELQRDYALFAEAVGWSMGKMDWRTYSELLFEITAPEGHLPAAPFYTKKGLAVGWVASLSLRLKECQEQ